MYAVDQKSIDLNSRKALGRSYLNANQLEEAIQVCVKILQDYPADIETYLILGDCYLAEGDRNAALLIFSQALEQEPDNPQVHRQLQLARNKDVNRPKDTPIEDRGAVTTKEELPTSPEAVASLLQELTRPASPIGEEEITKAAKLLDEIVHSPQPARSVAERLEEINGLLPALLELNIRQAQADRRDDLVEALKNLLENIQIQKIHKSQQSSSPARKLPGELRILSLGIQANSGLPEVLNLAEILDSLGCQVIEWDGKPVGDFDHYHLILVRNPHISPHVMELLASAHAARVPIGLYLDTDLEQMPLSHPAYNLVGLNTPKLVKAYTAALLLADKIIVPSDALADNLQAAGFAVCVIPPGWSDKNGLWLKSPKTRLTLNIGWVGAEGELEEVFTIRRMIVRVLREFPHVQLVIGCDAGVYQLFDNLPESRRLYLPLVNIDDYPYILSQMDILVLPLRNTSYNRTLSDRRLMEAGVRGIPWIASPIPAHMKWSAGGLIANTPDEWHTYLRQMVLDSELRLTLGQAGSAQAEMRRVDFIQKSWLRLIEEMQAPDK
jgi:tetratricopeptide (TPR) repeat protein